MSVKSRIRRLTDSLIRHLADSVTTFTLSTCGPSGEPHATPLYFTSDHRLNLYFFSDPDSQHSLDIAHDARAAVALYPECHGWQDIRGLQMRGVVRAVESGPEWDQAWEIYLAKFPFVSELREAVARNQLYVFIPNWIRLVDNRRGFSFKKEWNLE